MTQEATLPRKKTEEKNLKYWKRGQIRLWVGNPRRRPWGNGKNMRARGVWGGAGQDLTRKETIT